MKQVSYTDGDGRRWATMLPDGAPDSDAAMGTPLGPPSMEPLGLPKEIEVRLHNQLFERALFSPENIRVRRQDVLGAIMAALKVDINRVAALYDSPSALHPDPGAGTHVVDGTGVGIRSTHPDDGIDQHSDVRERTTQKPPRTSTSRRRSATASRG